MTVVVTGAAGFAGSHLLEHLVASGMTPVGWTRSRPPDAVPAGTTWEQLDLLDRGRVHDAIRRLRPSVVFHCAGAPHVAESWRNTSAALASNALTTHILLDGIRRAAVRCRVLVPGSAHLYAPSAKPLREDDPIAPASPYAFSKLAQEQLGLRAGQEDGVEVIVTRSFNHTGPRQSPAFAAPGFARQIALIERGLMPATIKVGNLDAQRELTDVRDTVRAYAMLVASGQAGSTYNVASGTARSIRHVLDALVARARVPVRVETDATLLRPHDIPVLVGDATRLQEVTGWRPAISFERMLDDLLDYWRTEVTRAH